MKQNDYIKGEIGMTTKAQERINELGLISRISHNLSKYTMGLDKSYSSQGFLAVCRIYMYGHLVEEDRIEHIINEAIELSHEEVAFFVSTGEFVNSYGGSAIHAAELLRPVLWKMGYTQDEGSDYATRYIRQKFAFAIEDGEFKRAQKLINLLESYHKEVGFDNDKDQEEFRFMLDWFHENITLSE